MTTINQALDKVRSLTGKKVGNGQCYGLSSLYSNLLGGAGLGAGVGSIYGNIGDTVSAHAIGTAYNWSRYGWSVVVPKSAGDLKPGGIINIKAHQGAPFYTGVYGHTGIITAVTRSYITLHEQNTAGREYVVEQVYALNSTFINQISSIVYPPNIETVRSTSATSNPSGKIKDEQGTMTVTVKKLNVRDTPSLKGNVVASYDQGDEFNYDSVYVGDGYIWVSYIAKSGLRRYVAAGKAVGNVNVEPFGQFN